MSEAALGRTQAERSAAMRGRLLEATVSCLVERGYNGTTTTEVVLRAGVSRGAQVHHFATKQELVLAAIDYVVERRHHEFRTTFEDLEPKQRTLTAALDLLWSLYRGDTFAAWLELAIAARTDEALRKPFHEMSERFTQRVEETFKEFYPSSPDAHLSRISVEFAFALLEGLALHRQLGIDADADELVGLLKELATMFAEDIGGTP